MKKYSYFISNKSILEKYDNFILEKFSDSKLKQFYYKLKEVESKFPTDFLFSSLDLEDFIKEVEIELREKERFQNKETKEKRIKEIENQIDVLENKLNDIFEKYVKIHFGDKEKEFYTLAIDDKYLYYQKYNKSLDDDINIFDNLDDFNKIQHDGFKFLEEDEKIAWRKISLPKDLTNNQILEFIDLFMGSANKYNELGYVKYLTEEVDRLYNKVSDMDSDIIYYEEDDEGLIKDIKSQINRELYRLENIDAMNFYDYITYYPTMDKLKEDIKEIRNILEIWD